MNTQSSSPVAAVEALFHSGFAGTTRLAPPAGPYFHGPRVQYEDLRGVDSSVPLPHDWDQFGRHPNLGTFRIYYEGGDASQRSARILADEQHPSKKILRFWIGQPNVTIEWSSGPEHKARVQAELYGNSDLREVYQSVRLRLCPTLSVLTDYPARISWLTLMEYWNQPFWDEPQHAFPFRISLGLEKPSADLGGPLYFSAHAQTKIGEQTFNNLWHARDEAFPVRFGEWMTLEVYYKEGDRQTGRFYAAVTPEGGARQVLFDVHDTTHHPDNPAPRGLTHFNPMKLYTSAKLVEFVTRRGAAMQIDWADFSLWQSRQPA